jgi:hypothetical protein
VLALQCCSLLDFPVAFVVHEFTSHNAIFEPTPQISPLRSPGFPVENGALMDPVRLSLRRAAYVAVAGIAKQEIRVRSGRDDKGKRGALQRE